MFADILHQLYRGVFWSHPALHKAYLRLRGYMIDFAGKDYVVQGFPRSGNTFLSVLLEDYAAKEVNLFTHLHAPAVFHYAFAENKVVFMPVRDPMDSVVSLIQMKGWSAERALMHYIDYYEASLPYVDKVKVLDFAHFTKDISATLKAVEAASGVPYKHDATHAEAEARTFALIDELNVCASGEINAKDVHRPHSERQADKAAVIADIQHHHPELLIAAQTLYAQFAARCILINQSSQEPNDRIAS